MKEELRITLVQPDMVWEDKQANLEMFEELLSKSELGDIVILPEMFTTGFSMNVEAMAESMDGSSVSWIKEKSAQYNVTLTGSLIISDSGKFYNRLIWAQPNGELKHYDKRHLFSFANEDEHYASGSDRLILEYEGWKICPLVCYDLRFPVFSRNQSLHGDSSDFEYDVLIYVANWPKARRRPWMNLLEARAHENQAYVLGVNRVGLDGKGIEYSGDSAAYSPKGEKISNVQSGDVAIETVVLSRDALIEFRKKFGAWKDKDSFTLH